MIRVHHHHRGILRVKLVRHQVSRVTGSFRCKDALDFFDCLLLLHVGLAEALEYTLLVSLQSARLAIPLANLNDLLLDHFIFELADLRPLLSCHLLGSLPNLQLGGQDLRSPLLLLLHVFSVLLLLGLE